MLVLVLTVPAFAGEIPYGITGDIPNGAHVTGEIPNGVTGDIPYNDTSSYLLLPATNSLINLIALLLP